jgi:hypothetical protein
LYCSPIITFLTYANQIKENERRWKCRTHGDRGNECRNLVGESEGKRPLQRQDNNNTDFKEMVCNGDRLCGLVVRVSGYRSRGPGFDSRHYQIF